MLESIEKLPRDRGWWGGWTRSGARLVKPGVPLYEFDLSSATSASAVLDRVLWFSKRAHDDATVAGVLRAIDDLLDPQANLCSWGRDKRLTKSQLLRELLREQPYLRQLKA